MSSVNDVQVFPDDAWWRARLAEAATALDARLRSGAVARGDRAAARAALQRAFAVVAGAEGVAAVAGAPLVRLTRETDALAAAVPAYLPPALSRPIGLPPLRSAVDAGLVGRIAGYAAQAERLSARIDAFLEATGGTPLRLFLAEVRAGDPASPEMAFTEG